MKSQSLQVNDRVEFPMALLMIQTRFYSHLGPVAFQVNGLAEAAQKLFYQVLIPNFKKKVITKGNDFFLSYS